MSRGCAVLSKAEIIRWFVGFWVRQQSSLRKGPTQNPRYPKNEHILARTRWKKALAVLCLQSEWPGPVYLSPSVFGGIPSVNSSFDSTFENMSWPHRSCGAANLVGRSIHFWGTWFFVSFHCLTWGFASMAVVRSEGEADQYSILWYTMAFSKSFNGLFISIRRKSPFVPKLKF